MAPCYHRPVRSLLLGAWLTTVVTAQEPAVAAPAATATSAMLTALDALEPRDGWLATPPGLQPELWQYYRGAFGIAPAGNEPDEARVALGRLLFFDQRLSHDRTLACASCHDPRHAFADPRPRSIGIRGQVLARNTPTIMNAALQKRWFWDGRASSLEEQAAGPLLNPAEMGMPDRATVVERVSEEPEYVALFELAYGRAPEFDDVTRALAAFQRTLVFVDAPFDAFRAGDDDAISGAAKQGFELFAEHCRSCHPVSLREPLLADGNFHNVGIGFDRVDHKELSRSAFARLRAAGTEPDAPAGELPADVIGEFGELGRALVSKLEYQVGAFRTAQLRNVALTAPYMHDGSLTTLWQVVDHYRQGGSPNTWQDPRIEKLDLTDEQVDQIVAFLFTLTDRRFAAANARAFAEQQRGPRRRP